MSKQDTEPCNILTKTNAYFVIIAMSVTYKQINSMMVTVKVLTVTEEIWQVITIGMPELGVNNGNGTSLLIHPARAH